MGGAGSVRGFHHHPCGAVGDLGPNKPTPGPTRRRRGVTRRESAVGPTAVGFVHVPPSRSRHSLPPYVRASLRMLLLQHRIAFFILLTPSCYRPLAPTPGHPTVLHVIISSIDPPSGARNFS